jgi:hypothetical protein
MKHFSFCVDKTRDLLNIIDDCSYAVFTKPDDDGWIRGYGQGSLLPIGVNVHRVATAACVMRNIIMSLGVTKEVGCFLSMGRCVRCDVTASCSWSPSLCDRCLIMI